ncbi:UDP-N-acetylmuramyl peptide synthase [Bifidobacterium pullorum subsp. saeculare]|uniref:UDP-N-acetylmuramyl peptide synthase n=1 Tax=Bifidobacterium pullorum subsp. saeculare TaxID=78257 RepID=A0A938WVF4_9BIFI|nr:UDP-N-acetylmuramyl peptide synthase [Bifidobacterium pullorum]MBM6698934.1 UDP-N-acetylmuramyl peptide synthase [Bifidobacterium pullorum subsp. saeculare]
MSAVSEAVSQRMTLGALADRYGWDLDPRFARTVTVTSLADSVDSVASGALYLPAGSVDAGRLAEAARHGAYAAVVPHAMRGAADGADIPLLYGEPTADQLGKLASDMTGAPASVLAVFAVAARDPEEGQAAARAVATLLHMLGNPVGVISAAGSRSLDRALTLRHPVGVLDAQRAFAIAAEDGAAAMVVCLDDRTLAPQALASVSVDVLGACSLGMDARRLAERYGFRAARSGAPVARTSDSDALAALVPPSAGGPDPRHLSLAIAMAMAAGVRRANIRNALRVAQDLH